MRAKETTGEGCWLGQAGRIMEIKIKDPDAENMTEDELEVMDQR